MIAVVQRTESSSVTIDGAVVGKIDRGFNILLGVSTDDSEKDMEIIAKKVVDLRIFEDENGKMNLSILDVDGSVLVVSQFTLLADCSHGRRPSFIGAARPEQAIPLYEGFVKRLSQLGVRRVETGRFGADMKVEILNDGPVTIILDSKTLKR